MKESSYSSNADKYIQKSRGYRHVSLLVLAEYNFVDCFRKILFQFISEINGAIAKQQNFQETPFFIITGSQSQMQTLDITVISL